MAFHRFACRVPFLRTLGSEGTPWERSDKITVWIGVLTLLLSATGITLTYLNSKESPSRPALACRHFCGKRGRLVPLPFCR